MGTGNIGRMWRFIHRKMERPFDGQLYPRILEVGAGNGEHLKALKCNYTEYVATDIRIDILLQNTVKTNELRIVSADAENLPFEDSYFDRVIITCVLPHLEAPFLAIQELYRVSKKGGKITIYVPCEPGLILRLIRFFSTSRKAKKMNIKNIGLIHYFEHRNYYLAIDTFIKEINFKNNASLKSRYFPFRFLTWNFNLFKIYQITK
jgi:ubiquinone/menaquinone biosynthesis C-methylase UbiE